MELSDLGAILLFANAIAHVFSVVALRQRGAESSEIAGVGAFVVINAVLGIAVLANQGWAEWLSMIFPAIGGIGLLSQLSTSKTPAAINYAILGLDAALVIIFAIVVFG